MSLVLLLSAMSTYNKYVKTDTDVRLDYEDADNNGRCDININDAADNDAIDNGHAEAENEHENEHAEAENEHAEAENEHAEAENEHAEPENEHAEPENEHAEPENEHGHADYDNANMCGYTYDDICNLEADEDDF